MRSRALRLLFPLAVAALWVGLSALDGARTTVTAQARTAAGAAPGNANAVTSVPVQGNIHMIVGAGVNLTASVGEQGILLVDTGERSSADKVIAVLRGLSSKPLQFIFNTQFHENHTGANEALAKFGRRVPDGVNSQAVILAHENVLTKMSGPSGQASARPVAAWPTDTFFANRKEVFFNGEAVQLFYEPGSTDGDAIVFFRKSDVISAGEIYSTTAFPLIDIAAGGSINGVIEGLNEILELAVPANNVEDGTIIIPSSGRLSDELDVAVYRDMVTIIRDRVQDAITRKQSLAEVKADKRMMLEYEGRYGGKGGPWTGDMFIEAVYKSLTATKQ